MKEEKIKAIIFDLYGTLIKLNQIDFIKSLYKILKLRRNKRLAESLRAMLTKDYSDNVLMVKDLINSLCEEDCEEELISQCTAADR